MWGFGQKKIEKPQYFDIHSHLNFKEFDVDRDAVIAKLAEENIWTTTVGTNLETSRQAVDLADKHPNIFATIGLHPALGEESIMEKKPIEAFNEPEFEKLVIHPKVVAIGECGLDYARLYAHPPEEIEKEKARQKAEFEKQIEFAVKYDKPLMIHCRDAYPDCLEILSAKKQIHGQKLRGNFHFFTSPVDLALKCIGLGFSVSFTGPITFVPQYQSMVMMIPLEHVMVETDSPYAAPIPHRGKRNEPLFVRDIVSKIADIKTENEESVRQLLVDNALTFFGIKI